MQITLDRSSAVPLYTQLTQQIQHRIRTGTLPSGSRLPTIRALSRQLGVTRLTIHSAYNELQAGGWVEATVGRGTFVAERTEPAAVADLGREVSASGLVSDMLRMAQLPGLRSLAMADGAPELYPIREFGKSLDEALASGGPLMLGYAAPQGDPILRTALVELLSERGMRTSPDEIVITSGATQALAMLGQTLAQPGDTIIVERPTYLGALSVFGARGLRMIGAPIDQHGIMVDELEALILAHRPRFIYLIPAFQNPTGVCLSVERHARLVALAARHRIPIVEDDIYARLVYEGSVPPALQAEDRSGMVIHVGSFSKMLLPGVRIGYIAAAPQWIGRLIAAKQTSDLCSPPLLQRAMALFINHGWLGAHVRRIIPQYRDRRDALLTAMSRYFPSGLRWTEPHGGFCVWVALPPTIATTDLYLAAIERGVAFAPGDVFFAGQAPQPHIRLAFSILPPEQITEAARTLGDLLSTHMMRRSMIHESPGDYMPLV